MFAGMDVIQIVAALLMLLAAGVVILSAANWAYAFWQRRRNG